MRLRLHVSAGAGLLLAAAMLASSACSSNVVGTGAASTTGTTTGSDTTGSGTTTACLPDETPCTEDSVCCNGSCSFGRCNCMEGVSVNTCMCDGVAMGGCSDPGNPCLQDGGPAEGGPDDGGAPVCQCMQVLYESPCP